MATSYGLQDRLDLIAHLLLSHTQEGIWGVDPALLVSPAILEGGGLPRDPAPLCRIGMPDTGTTRDTRLAPADRDWLHRLLELARHPRRRAAWDRWTDP